MTQPLGLSFNDSVKQAVYEVLSDPLSFPDVFKGWVTGWIEANPPTLPISQITGFAQFAAQSNVIATLQSTSSSTYTDLATVGPELTGLPDGQYVVLFGAAGFSATAVNWMSVQTNATAAVDADACTVNATNAVSIARAVTKSLSDNGSNTITCKYRSDRAASVSFQNRWLIALKFANL